MFTYMFAATAAEVFTYIGYVIVAILALMVMIVIHESGHYLSGKLLGFKIDEFAIGFGPKVFSRTNKSGELFSIRPIPIGGFCAFHGEDEDGKDDADAFNNQKAWKRLIVLFSGAFFNFLSAIFIISLFFSIYGQPLPVVQSVYEGSAAYQDGNFKSGDAILQVDGKAINLLMPEDLQRAFADCGDTAKFKVLRRTYDESGKVTSKEIITFEARKADYNYQSNVLDENGEVVGTETKSLFGFGISWNVMSVTLNFFRAFGRAWSFCFFVVFKILATFGALITGKAALSGAGGTITAVKTIAEVSMGGFGNLMYVVVILSANLAVFNLLPIPALDGSRMLFTLIEIIFRKPIPRKIEAVIHAVGLVVLLLLAVFLDIFHLVSN